MYHDKRFQVDPGFLFVAFSHHQVKASSTQSFLVARRENFPSVADRFLSLDMGVLRDLIARMSAKEDIIPETEDEKKCWRVIQDLETVAVKVQGSAAGRKWMRTEIWSLMAHIGSPIWYITIAPTDIKHPICFYLADLDQEYRPNILPPTEDAERDARFRAVISNPVAGARFFHFVIQSFIKHVLGVNEEPGPGYFGETSGYYGTAPHGRQK
ncbi:uncharacterized protein SCHCODRAFT_02668857 [Schizophyllum commune H4-8]|uniref:uncharacterized protein n=1 Tax=Schizophyllum commune (strain H4-8 / FGSC 9210) TaxID=578458 RepID=UPI00215ECB54|nr:uncharacterized protein SCHCODRAFT_02668857 [Schizophyllum commune H4-8]KAI5891529.1 hypothetical protein SCHCODRAFT_02668857 [Schizophyllum commune H4-8]